MFADTNWLSTISQNVSDANTTGYKKWKPSFRGSSILAGVAAEAGTGVDDQHVSIHNSLQGSVVRDRPRPTSRSGRRIFRRLGRPAPSISPATARSPGRPGQPRQFRRLLPDGQGRRGLDSLVQAVSRTCRKLTPLRPVSSPTPTTAGPLSRRIRLPPRSRSPRGQSSLNEHIKISSVYTAETSLVAYDNLGGAHQARHLSKFPQ